MNEQALVSALDKYGLDGVVQRCTYQGEHCRFWFTIRERGYSEHIVAHMHALLIKNYPEKGVRLLFMKTLMGGFELSSDGIE